MRYKTLGSHKIRQKVGECGEPGRTKVGNVWFILPSSSCEWCLRSASFRTTSWVSRPCLPLNTWLAVCWESSSPTPSCYTPWSSPSLFLYPHPYSGPALLEILEPYQNKFILLTATDPAFSFFPLEKPPSHLG